MKMPQPQVSDARQLWSLLSSRRSWPAWTVLLVALVATAWGTRLEEEDAEAHAAREFTFAAGEVKVRVEERLLAHEQVLRAGAGLFDASSAVERAEWRGFVGHLALDARRTPRTAEPNRDVHLDEAATRRWMRELGLPEEPE